MKHILIATFLLPAFSSAQTKNAANIENRKQEVYSDYSKSWLIPPANRNDTDKEEKTSYYPNGAIKTQGNRINGDWVEFFESGKIKIKQTFVNGKLSGETFCYSEKGNILLPRFIPPSAVKNDTSILNSSRLTVYSLFDARDSANAILDMSACLSDSIRICDNGNLTIYIGTIQFIIMPKLLGVHVTTGAPCKSVIPAQRFTATRVKEEIKKDRNNINDSNEKESFKTQLGKIEVQHKRMVCDNTGHHPVTLTNDNKTIYFKDIGNLIFFEHDIDKGGNKEFFIVNYSSCKGTLEIYKIDEE